MQLRLTKHEGLGNDFLVLLDRDGNVVLDDHPALTPELIRRLCDRHRGVGADGIMRATPGAFGGHGTGNRPEADAAMELYNADGTRAEMSGNGIRCLAQALLLEGWARPPEVTIATDAGIRVLTVVDGPNEGPGGGTTHVLSVDMGEVTVDGEAPEWAQEPSVRRAAWATAGNPHLVIEVADPGPIDGIDLVELGEKVNTVTPGGVNVHLLAAGPGQDEVTIRTYERGVGLTEACGTGACASAVVAASWGLVGDDQPGGAGGPTVIVRMLGGAARVNVGADVRLIGPATAVAVVEFPWPAGER